MEPGEDVEQDADEHVERKGSATSGGDRRQIGERRAVHELARQREVSADEVDVLDPRDVRVPVLRQTLRVAEEEAELLRREHGRALEHGRAARRSAREAMDDDELVRLSNRRVRTLRASSELTQDPIRNDA
ncbi:MAG: hypothetical protein KF850_05570 [Labilithrix sp.]|nr:hypothetical protein [Labilithrix sp.]